MIQTYQHSLAFIYQQLYYYYINFLLNSTN